eukprot:5616197-Lingulodinium_polyedra.AAC.1
MFTQRKHGQMQDESPFAGHAMAIRWLCPSHAKATAPPSNAIGMVTQWPLNGQSMTNGWPPNDLA